MDIVEGRWKHRWVLPLVGLLFIAAGILMLVFPAATVEGFALLFPIAFCVFGVFEIFFALMNTQQKNWGWFLVSGILDILIYIILIRSTVAQEMEILAFFVGFWLMFRGCMAIGHAFDMKHAGVKNWPWLLVSAILTLALSFLVLALPIAAVDVLFIWISVSFLCMGVSYVILGFLGKPASV